MAKEIIPPTPVPVGKEDNLADNSLYCAAFMSYDNDGYSDITKSLVEYLDSVYESDYLGGTTKTYVTYEKSYDDIINDILDQNIPGINKNTIGKYVIVNVTEGEALIFVNLY